MIRLYNCITPPTTTKAPIRPLDTKHTPLTPTSNATDSGAHRFPYSVFFLKLKDPRSSPSFLFAQAEVDIFCCSRESLGQEESFCALHVVVYLENSQKKSLREWGGGTMKKTRQDKKSVLEVPETDPSPPPPPLPNLPFPPDTSEPRKHTCSDVIIKRNSS